MEDVIPKPILFNCWKHHQGFILQEIRKMKMSGNLSRLKINLKKIGNSTTDLYTGQFSVKEITDYTISVLDQKNIREELNYQKWISENKQEYQSILYPDDSIWVFKIGIEEGKYVHIHPGRNVPHTVRTKANVLKTAIAVNLMALIDQQNPLNIETINRVRKEIIDLDPIKFVTFNQELGRIIYDFALKLEILN